jgi:uncharacterized protein (DUF488 family)
MVDYNKVILGTGSYDTVNSGNTVSITGDGGHAWNYFGRAYKKLAPKLDTYETYASKLATLNELKDNLIEYNSYRKQIENEYIESYYNTRLKDIYVYDLLDELHARFGNNIILLCHEPIDEFCHRRVLADYIELETGIYIPEISVDNDYNITKHVPIRYKNRLFKVINK